MPDKQVYAIYRKKQEEKERLKQYDRVVIYEDAEGATHYMDTPVVSKEPEPYHQIDIWEYLNDRRA